MKAEIHLSQSEGLSDLRRRFRIQLLLTIAGGIGIFAIILPFTWDVSPFAAATASRGELLAKDLWRPAMPFFLPALITIASLRWLISGTLSRSERMIVYVMSAASVCITLSFIVNPSGWPTDLIEWLIMVIPLVTFGFGIISLLRTRYNVMLKPFRAIMSMQVAYLANCLLCLSAFFGQWQIGAYCSLVTAIVYLIQMILVFRRDTRHIEASVV
jgi:hypothetical protein